MRNILIIAVLIFTFFCGSIQCNAQDQQKYSKAKVFLNVGDLNRLASLGVAVDNGEIKKDTYIIAEFSEREIGIIKKNGFQYEILIEDMAKFYADRNKKDQEEIQTDEDVWSKIFKPIFDKNQITKTLIEKSFNTKIDTLKFNYTWKNERWHCYEPVQFNLKREDRIKEKAYRWAGKLQWLSSNNEDVKIHFLTMFPKKKTLKDFVRKVLLHNVSQSLKLDFITPEEGDNFAESLKKDIESHK